MMSESTGARILRVKPPVWLLGCAVAAIVLHVLAPIRLFTPGAIGYGAAAALAAFGIGVNLWTDRLFKLKGVDVLPTSTANREFITSGPFRFTRNPMYLGMVAVLVGIAVALGTLLPFLCAACFLVLVNATYIPHEERKLAAQFGDAFAAYAQRTRRWL